MDSSEEAQLAQTIEMFEVITQSQPNDYQSLEILKEAYAKAGRETDALTTSKRIAQAYVQMGQLSSAILEYETILQQHPEDPDVLLALKQIESKAGSFPANTSSTDTITITRASVTPAPNGQNLGGKPAPREVEDGRRTMHRVFVESKLISSGDFDLCWPTPDLSRPPTDVVEPLIHVLAERSILPVEKALRALCDKSRLAYLPLGHYDLDIDLARTFPAMPCRRWCVLPIDRMSKSVLVATANPFNQQAAKELAEATQNRLIWYIVPPVELMKNIRKVFR